MTDGDPESNGIEPELPETAAESPEPGPDEPENAKSSDTGSADASPDGVALAFGGDILVFSLILESVLVALALFLALIWQFYDHNQPIHDWSPWWSLPQIGAGIVTAIVMAAVVISLIKFDLPVFRNVTRLIDEKISRMFADLNLFQLALMAASAGIGEELFFRWCLQGGIAQSVGGNYGWLVGLIAASALFGAMHWLNTEYAIMATVLGLVLGMLMIITGSYVAPAIAHGLYDFIALVYLARFRQPQQVQLESGNE